MNDLEFYLKDNSEPDYERAYQLAMWERAKEPHNRAGVPAEELEALVATMARARTGDREQNICIRGEFE